MFEIDKGLIKLLIALTVLGVAIWTVSNGLAWGFGTLLPVEKPPVLPRPPRCEIGWTLQMRNGVIEKRIPVVICEELNGKWITAKQ